MIILQTMLLMLLVSYITAMIFKPELIVNSIVTVFKTNEIRAGKTSVVGIVIAVSIIMYFLN